jgi:soluble lytic murein transglycosylase-like protein
MRKLLLLGGAAYGLYWAYGRGYIPQLAPVIDVASHILPQELWGLPDMIQAQKSAAIKDASGGQIVPILGESEVVETNKYEAILRTNWQFVSPWARENIHWAAAIMKTENGALNPAAIGDKGAAFGLYQVHVPTAETCYRVGYTRFQPTAEVLKTVEGAVYFGTAEMQRLSEYDGVSRPWIVKAYNGGAGWEHVNEKYKRDRESYYKRVAGHVVAMYATGEGVA